MVQDLLRLRLLTVVAACILVAYFYLRPEPMMTVVWWNLFFIALNVFQIAVLTRKKRGKRQISFAKSIPVTAFKRAFSSSAR